jgi:hypothetical protein
MIPSNVPIGTSLRLRSIIRYISRKLFPYLRLADAKHGHANRTVEVPGVIIHFFPIMKSQE